MKLLRYTFLLLLFSKFDYLLAQQYDFGLMLAPKSCETEYKNYSSSLMVLGNSYYLQGNKLILKYHDIQLLKTIFKDANDGIAVDLMTKDQFDCASANKLNEVPTHDGILLQPVYRDALFARNTSSGDYRYIGELATIPDSLKNKELLFSIVIINDGKVCKYLMPAPFSTADYPIQVVSFEFEETNNVNFVSSGTGKFEIVKYGFGSSKIDPDKSPVITKKGSVAKVEILAFSSIDGEQKKNAYLDSSRAAYIAKDLKLKLGVSDSLIKRNHGENWNLAFFQFNFFGADSITRKKQQEIQSLVNSRTLKLPLDSLLKAQRICEARIFYQSSFGADSNATEFLKGNLIHAVATKNNDLFIKTARKLYEQADIDPIIYDKVVFDHALKERAVVAAYAALLSRNIKPHMNEISRFMWTWYSKTSLSQAAKTNLGQLYCLLNQELLKEWDVKNARISKMLSPDKMISLCSEIKSLQVQLNMHISFCKYYGKINDSKNAQQYFSWILKYFDSGMKLSPQSAENLAKYYNSWGAYQQAVTLLEDYIVVDLLSEDGVFILAENEMLLQSFTQVKLNLQYTRTALLLNKTRWCKWMNDYKQNLRNSELKSWYCESCDH